MKIYYKSILEIGPNVPLIDYKQMVSFQSKT